MTEHIPVALPVQLEFLRWWYYPILYHLISYNRDTLIALGHNCPTVSLPDVRNKDLVERNLCYADILSKFPRFLMQNSHRKYCLPFSQVISELNNCCTIKYWLLSQMPCSNGRKSKCVRKSKNGRKSYTLGMIYVLWR